MGTEVGPLTMLAAAPLRSPWGEGPISTQGHLALGRGDAVSDSSVETLIERGGVDATIDF
jgi:hypothetical protein